MNTALRMNGYVLLTGIALGLAGCQVGAGHAESLQAADSRWKQMRASLLLPMAQQQFDAGDLDQAEKTLLDAISVDGQNARLYILAGRVALERGQLERSYQRLHAAIELDPEIPEAYYFQGIVLQRWKRYESAYECYRHAYEAEPDNPAFLLAMSEMLVATDRQDEAMELLMRKVDYFDQSAQIRVALGQLCTIEGDYIQAVDYLKQASLLEPEDLQIVEELATAQLNAGLIPLATLNLERLCAETELTDRSDLRRTLASIYLGSNRGADARAMLLKLTREDPKDEESWIRLGEIAWSTNDTAGTLLAANRVIAVAPDRHEGYLMAGMVLHRRQHLDRALGMFDRAAELAPRSAVPMILRGITLEQAGQPDAAAQAYTEALRRKPSDTNAKRLLAHLAMETER